MLRMMTVIHFCLSTTDTDDQEKLKNDWSQWKQELGSASKRTEANDKNLWMKEAHDGRTARQRPHQLQPTGAAAATKTITLQLGCSHNSHCNTLSLSGGPVQSQQPLQQRMSLSSGPVQSQQALQQRLSLSSGPVQSQQALQQRLSLSSGPVQSQQALQQRLSLSSGLYSHNRHNKDSLSSGPIQSQQRLSLSSGLYSHNTSV